MYTQSIPRRRFLRVGGAGLFGVTLPGLIAAQSARGSRTESEKSCLFIVVSGGLSHIDTLDPKPHAPPEVRGPYAPIATRTPGVCFTEMMPRLAQSAHKFCVLRSQSHADTVHVTAAHTMLTGQFDGSRQNNSPFIGSLVAKFRPATAAVPTYVWLHNMKTGTNKVPRYESGLNTIGYEHAPLRVGYELDNPSDPDFRVTHFDPPVGISVRQIDQRYELLQSIERPGPVTLASAATDRFTTLQQTAHDLVTGPAARQAFDLNRETEQVRDRYGRHPLGQYLLMARRLIEAGVRLVTVTAWPGLAPGESQPTVTQVWDMHDDRYADGDSMFGNGPFGMKWSLPRLDQAVSALLEDLYQRGLLENTLVALVSEFGRTPKFEGEGRGRGHWPHAYSGLLAGCGIRGGMVYGESDTQGAYVSAGRPISHADFGATLYHALGIPPDTRYGPDGFSFRLSDGKPLREIFG